MAKAQVVENTQEEIVGGEIDVKTISDEHLQDALRSSVVHDKLKEIQSNSMRKLLERQNELIERLEGLSEIPNMAEAERQRAIIEADLQSVRIEYAKRQEDVGVLVNELFALYDELGLQSKIAGEDSSEDITKRKDAVDAVTNATVSIKGLEAALVQARVDKSEAEGSWMPIGRKTKVAAAEQVVAGLKKDIVQAKKDLETAQGNIAVVEEQIEVDKRDRVRKASLAENFALIRQFTNNATTILKSDIEETADRANQTEKALNSALKKKVETARALDALRDELQDLERDLVRERNALDEIPDQGSTNYAEQQTVVAKLDLEMTDKKGTELKLNTTHMAMTQAIEANKSTLAGLKVQRDTAEVYYIKLTTAEKTAEIMGRNIDRMIKNTFQETASDSLDKVTDSMTITTVVLGIKAEKASSKNRNDAIERHDELMKNMKLARDDGDKAIAFEAQRYMAIDKKIREGYKDRGVDLNMSHLASAAAVFEAKAVETVDGSVEEDFITY